MGRTLAAVLLAMSGFYLTASIGFHDPRWR